VLSQELDVERLSEALGNMAKRQLDIIQLKQPSPFAFPLMVERFREQLSTEKLSDRIARMLASLEEAAGPVAKTQDKPDDNNVESVSISERITFGMSDHTGRSSSISPKRSKRIRKVSKPLPLL
jgi:ATP-dependent Lhr-like helicase